MQEKHADELIIGSQHAEVMGYSSFVGCKARVVLWMPAGLIVQIREVINPLLKVYEGENLLIHIDDSLPVVDDAPLAPHYPKEPVSITPGSLIEITGTFAEAMDYVEAVGQPCVIEYVQPAYVQVMVLSGPLTGETRDIHVEDIVKEKDVEVRNHTLMIVNDEKEEFVYVPDGHEQDPVVKQKIALQLEKTKTKGSPYRVLRGDLTYTIGHYGYKVTHIDDVEAPPMRAEKPS